jgi:hypothetical protein
MTKRRQFSLFREKNHHAAREIVGPHYQPACPDCPSLPWQSCPCHPERAAEAEARFEYFMDLLSV